MDVPFEWGVCPTCDGDGTCVAPSVDAGGIPAHRMVEEPGFARRYHRGTYDVECPECSGKRVVPALAPRDPETDRGERHHRAIRLLEEAVQAARETRATQAKERAMGA